MTRRSRRFRMSMLVTAAVAAGIGAVSALRVTIAAQTNARPNIVVVLPTFAARSSCVYM